MGERSFVKLVPKTPKQMVLEQHTATLSRSFPSLPPGRRKALLFPFTPSISSERQDVLPGYIFSWKQSNNVDNQSLNTCPQ